MVGVIVRHRVNDYAAWKPVFDEHGAVRRQHGALGHRLYRAGDDPNQLVIVNLFRDAAGAQAFAADPSLPEVMRRAGVADQPDVYLCEEVEVADYTVPVG